MPTFKPNDLYGEGGYDMVLEDGSIFPDPFGELYKEHNPNPDPTGVLAQTAALTPAVPAAGLDMRLAQNSPPDPAALVGSADGAQQAADFAAQFNPGPKPVAGEHVTGGPQEDPFALPKPAPAGSAASASPPDPTAVIGSADRPVTTTGSQTTTSSSTERSSSGLSAADQAAAAGDIDFTVEQKTSAANAQQDVANLEAQQAERRRQELLASSAAGLEKTMADLAVQDKLDEEVEKKLKAGADFKPDRTQLFHGDNGALFGISAAIAAMTGGWLMGMGKTGGRNPYLDTVMQIIENNANDQIRKNSSVVQELLRQKGDIKAVKNELKARQGRYVDQQLEARLLRDKSELVQSQGAATRAAVAADISKWDAEQKRALMRTESEKISKSTNRVVSSSTATKPAGSADPKRAEKVSALRKLDSALEIYGRGMQSGALASMTGWQENLGANALYKWFGVEKPENVEQQANLNEIMKETLMQLSREPSNKMQDIIKDLNIPSSDSEIPVMFKRLQTARQQLVEDIQTPTTHVPEAEPTRTIQGPR